jgi:integrase
MVATAIHTGIRASELRGLPWSSVDLKHGKIKIVQRADENGVIGKTKSKAGKRTINIPGDLVQILREWKLESVGHGLVFPTSSGKPESLPNIYNRCWKPLLEAARMPGRYNWHSLRHFHASLLIDDGANPKEVQVELGHASIKITYDIYGTLFRDEAADKSRKERADRLAGKLR